MFFSNINLEIRIWLLDPVNYAINSTHLKRCVDDWIEFQFVLQFLDKCGFEKFGQIKNY